MIITNILPEVVDGELNIQNLNLFFQTSHPPQTSQTTSNRHFPMPQPSPYKTTAAFHFMHKSRAKNFSNRITKSEIQTGNLCNRAPSSIFTCFPEDDDKKPSICINIYIVRWSGGKMAPVVGKEVTWRSILLAR